MLPGRFDHLVVIERTGRAADGSHYNARKMNFKHLVNPIDDRSESQEPTHHEVSSDHFPECTGRQPRPSCGNREKCCLGDKQGILRKEDNG